MASMLLVAAVLLLMPAEHVYAHHASELLQLAGKELKGAEEAVAAGEDIRATAMVRKAGTFIARARKLEPDHARLPRLESKYGELAEKLGLPVEIPSDEEKIGSGAGESTDKE